MAPACKHEQENYSRTSAASSYTYSRYRLMGLRVRQARAIFRKKQLLTRFPYRAGEGDASGRVTALGVGVVTTTRQKVDHKYRGSSAASRSRPSGRHAPSYTARLRAAVLAFECLHMQASSTPNLSFRVAVVDGGIEHMPRGDRGGAWGGVERPLF